MTTTETQNQSSTQASAPEAPDFAVSARAAKRIAKILAAEGPEKRLRVSVSGGGCSGFQYGFELDDALSDEDRVFAKDGVEVVVDDISLEYLRGSELDFVDELIGAAFQIKNPNATASCGCGTSFAI